MANLLDYGEDFESGKGCLKDLFINSNPTPYIVIMMRVVISGSFKFIEEMKELAKMLENEDIECILPKHFKSYENSVEIEKIKKEVCSGDYKLTTNELIEIGKVESWFFDQIRRADCIIVYNKNGYIGINTSTDIGYALALKKPVILLYEPEDEGIKGLISSGLARIIHLDDIKKHLTQYQR